MQSMIAIGLLWFQDFRREMLCARCFAPSFDLFQVFWKPDFAAISMPVALNSVVFPHYMDSETGLQIIAHEMSSAGNFQSTF